MIPINAVASPKFEVRKKNHTQLSIPTYDIVFDDKIIVDDFVQWFFDNREYVNDYRFRDGGITIICNGMIQTYSYRDFKLMDPISYTARSFVIKSIDMRVYKETYTNIFIEADFR